MKIIVAGGRNFNNYKIIDNILSKYINPEVDVIVSGDARGADLLGADWGAKHGVPIQHFPAYWDTYGKNAGFIRNAEMGDFADAAICIWDGQSKGTKHMIETMCRLNKPCYVFNYNGQTFLTTATFAIKGEEK